MSPDEIRIPINAKIPKSLHDSLVAAVEAAKYRDKTACITEALEKILHNTQEATILTMTYYKVRRPKYKTSNLYYVRNTPKYRGYIV
jgi:hypothetical protein